MLVSERETLIKRARFLATQARDPEPHYQHSVVGYNYRLSNLLAAVGRAQLEGLDARIQQRRRIRERYREALAAEPGLRFLVDPPEVQSNAWLTCLQVDPAEFGADREQIRLHLEAADIESRPVWKPMHQQPVWDGTEMFGGAVSDTLFERGLCLPSGSNLSTDDQLRVIDRILSTPR